VQINHLAAGRVPDGATVERAVASPFLQGETISLELNSTDFSTAQAMTDAINTELGEGTAHALDGRVIDVKAPTTRTGACASWRNWRICRWRRSSDRPRDRERAHRLDCDKPHGISGAGRDRARQPVGDDHLHAGGVAAGPLSADRPGDRENGHPAQAGWRGTDEAASAANLADLVKALNSLGANPADLVAILQALKAAGALRADLESSE